MIVVVDVQNSIDQFHHPQISGNTALVDQLVDFDGIVVPGWQAILVMPSTKRCHPAEAPGETVETACVSYHGHGEATMNHQN